MDFERLSGDLKDLRRVRKDSSYWYGRLIVTRGASLSDGVDESVIG